MRIHTSFLTTSDVWKAATLAGVDFTKFTEHGSRSRERAFNIVLTGSSTRNQNMGGQDKAATWDEWGIFLGALYSIDPEVKCWAYQNAEHFHWVTGNRYAAFLPADKRHRDHKWEFSGEAVTGAYMVHACKCGAVRRFLHRKTWAEFTDEHA